MKQTKYTVSESGELRAALTQCVAAFANKGEATSLHMWNERMKKANQYAQTALDATK